MSAASNSMYAPRRISSTASALKRAAFSEAVRHTSLDAENPTLSSPITADENEKSATTEMEWTFPRMSSSIVRPSTVRPSTSMQAREPYLS